MDTKKTKIVCTIGPASESKETLEDLMLNGMNVARLNFSHGNHEEQQEKVDAIKEVSQKLGLYIAIMIDLKGPEIRLGNFSVDKVDIETGQKFTFTTRDVLGDEQICSVSHKDLPKDLKEGATILVDDGLVEFRVEKIEDTEIHTTALNSGEISNHKGVNIPGVSLSLPAITDKDREDIIFAVKNKADFIAGSFIRKEEDVFEIRKILEENGGDEIRIISKIENQEGVDNLDQIIDSSDGIMVARGDLGVEIPAEDMPLVQKDMIRKTYLAGKPVITATQMLDSMIRNPRPTRAEVTDVANAIIDGTSAIMLSGETASGKYPIQAVKMMSSIAKKIEESVKYDLIFDEQMEDSGNAITNSVSRSACVLAKDLKAGAIIAATSSGNTARQISKFRPQTKIIAATSNEHVCRRMALSWGVEPVLIDNFDNNDDLVRAAIDEALQNKLIQEGDTAVLTAGIPVGQSGYTNFIKVQTAANPLVSGIGIGEKIAKGKAVLARDSKDLEEKFEDGDIIVMTCSYRDIVPFMERASAIIVEEGGFTSHAAIVGLELGLATIIGAQEVTSIIEDGQKITVDARYGAVYAGEIEIR